MKKIATRFLASTLFLLWPGLLFCLCSCTSYLTFTNRLRNDFHLEPEDMRHVQFYNSAEFSLRRETTVGSAGLTPGGVLKTSDGRLIEELVIKKHTPCIAINVMIDADPPRSMLNISFMPGDNNNFLVFGVPDDQVADLDYEFLLLAPIWEGPQPKVKYDNKLWNIDLSKHPFLVIRKTALDRKKVVKVLPGRIVP
jgi:hypothetical protein